MSERHPLQSFTYTHIFIEELIAIETSTYRTQAIWYSSVCLSAAGLLITAALGSVNSIISHLISKGDLIDSLEPMTHVQDERLSVCVLFECASAGGDTLRPTLRSVLHSYAKTSYVSTSQSACVRDYKSGISSGEW